ncbi:MAG: DDE-type integrase/transposase/recombinase [Tissierellia bacterium]|nr:DDE-type integrase/transposase/recombinase [Tissierellia bacterium]
MKQSYHTDFAIQFKLDLLEKEDYQNIPKSTLYSWKTKDFSKLIGTDIVFSDEKLELIKTFLSNQALLKAAKGLYFIHSVWVKIMENVRGIKTLLRKNKELIVETIDFVIPLMDLEHACKLFKISLNQFYAWKRKIQCLLSPTDICVKQNPLTVSPTELNTIKQFIEDEQYKNFPLVAVYYEMMRKGKAFMSLTTFYKYAKLFDNAVKRRLFKAKQKTGIRAVKPKEIIHADVCVYRPLDYTKIFIYFIIDNFSRMILGWKISTQYNSSIMLDNLKTVYCEYLLEKENPLAVLMVDDGIENKGFVSSAIEKQEIKLNRLVAQKDIHFSNSIIEAVNKRMKYDFLFREQLLDFNHTQRFLETAVKQYNNRPHSALFGYTPKEVFYGAIPDKTLFKPQMEQAKALRKAENQALTCDSCAFTLDKQD